MAQPIDVARLSEGHEERFLADESDVEFAAPELLGEGGSKPRRFKCVAYTGKDVSRSFGRMVVNVEGIKRASKMGMLLEHDDLSGVAVCDRHSKEDGKLELSGYFLDDVASQGKASALIAKADQGWPLKMSIGIRFRKHSFVEDGVKFECNGRNLKGPMVVVDECTLFETSFIHVNPADLDTEASVMRAKAQEQRMAEANKTEVESGAPVVTELDKLGGQTRDEILAEGEKRAMARLETEHNYEAALHQAWPGKSRQHRREAARAQKLTIEQVQQAGVERMKKKLARFEARDAETKEALREVAGRYPVAGSKGADPARLEVVQERSEIMIAGSIDERAMAELRSMPRLQDIFTGQQGGPDARALLATWLRVKGRTCTRDGRPVLTDLRGGDKRRVSPQTLASLEQMSRDVQTGLRAERLDVGSSGPDYSNAVVNGFQGQFYHGYEEELSKNWSMELSFQIPTDQEAEIVRWLAAPPMLQEWKGPRIAKGMQLYQQLIQAVKFEMTLNVDRFDWDHQKFELIAKSFGLAGAIASQHWDIRFSNLLETNPTAYDSVAMFAATHTLGGDSGTIINDYSSSGTGATKGIAPTLNVSNVASPTQLEWANIILQLTPKFRSFAWANGVKMHGTARQWGIMVHPNVEGNLQAAISSERLDLGASNPLFGQRSQYKVISNPYLTDPTVGYIFRLDTQNKALLRAEADPLEMNWQGPGSHMAFHEDKYAMGMRCIRSIAPGAFETALRFKLGNT